MHPLCCTGNGNNLIYITQDGKIGMEDLRSNSKAIEFNIGLEYGFISQMIPLRYEKNFCIGTLNGSLLLFDIRGKLIINSYQINDDNSPIHCIQPFNPAFNYGNSIQQSDMAVAVSFGTCNNQLAVFDLNQSETQITADIFYYFSPLE